MVTKSANSLADRYPWFESSMAYLIDSESLPFLFFASILCAYWFRKDAEQLNRRERIVSGIVGGVCSLVVARLLAFMLPFRDRPMSSERLHLAHFNVEVALRTWSSMPSDHAALAFSLIVTVWFLSRFWGIAVLAAGICLSVLPRLTFGLHWASDLVTGSIIGASVGMLFQSQRIRSRLAKWFLRQVDAHPALYYGFSFAFLFELVNMFRDLRGLAIVLFATLKHH